MLVVVVFRGRGCSVSFWGSLSGEAGRKMTPVELGDVLSGWARRSRVYHTERENTVTSLPF